MTSTIKNNETVILVTGAYNSGQNWNYRRVSISKSK